MRVYARLLLRCVAHSVPRQLCCKAVETNRPIRGLDAEPRVHTETVAHTSFLNPVRRVLQSSEAEFSELPSNAGSSAFLFANCNIFAFE